MSFRYLKTGDVKSPNRGTPGSAGVDLFIPNDFIKTTLLPQQRILIPSGIKVDLPENTVLIVFNKSGVASKYGLDVLACCIDWDYQGIIHINVVNTGDDTVELLPGMKIVQVLHMPYYSGDPEEFIGDEASFYYKETERGTGGFGSTNRDNL